MKLKIERTINLEEAPEQAKHSLSLAVDGAIQIHKLIEILSKESDKKDTNVQLLNDNIHNIRETLYEMDLMLSDASSILINYQAAKVQKAASDKQLAEQEEENARI